MRNVESQPNYLITLPKRGLRVIAPEHTRRVMELAQKHKAEGTRFTEDEKADLWPDREKARIYLMKQCGTLKRRYPEADQGRQFMESVDYDRRDELMERARSLSSDIVNSWEKISPDKPIAVVLFGSVAKGLVKHSENPDPSNIDLAVIGDVTREEKERLLDEIRPHRRSVQEWILGKVPFINSDERNPGNAGVIVQSLETVAKDNFEPAKNYITSGAIPLHDPAGIWQEAEDQALKSTIEKMQKKRILPKREVVYSAT
jgi:predicted nucleotidyltransferase